MIADEIRRFIRRYLIVTPEQEVAMTVWVLHTWAFPAAIATPYLVLLSATRQSGKTRALEVLERLVRTPLRTSGMSEAAMFRIIEEQQPTLLLDEVDAIFGSTSERTEPLRGVLNSGNRLGGQVARCVPPAWDVQAFSTFSPKALAGIDNGSWPDTVLDRSIVLRLKRRTPGETVDRFRWRTVEAETEPIREAAAPWADERIDRLTTAVPETPDLNDRACDAWEPLFAIADELGGDWPAWTREAAVSLFRQQERQEESPGLVLLAHIRDCFDTLGVEKLKSAALCAELRRIEDGPWTAWGRGGVAPNDVALLLRPFGIGPRVIRLDNSHDRGSTARGYVRGDFEDTWQRYLPAGEGSV